MCAHAHTYALMHLYMDSLFLRTMKVCFDSGSTYKRVQSLGTKGWPTLQCPKISGRFHLCIAPPERLDKGSLKEQTRKSGMVLFLCAAVPFVLSFVFPPGKQ